MNTSVIECIVIALVLSIIVVGSALCVYGINSMAIVLDNLVIV